MLPGVVAASTESSRSFVQFLAGLTAKPDGSARECEALADDVVTLSYEQALQGHGRYRGRTAAVAKEAMKAEMPDTEVETPQLTEGWGGSREPVTGDEGGPSQEDRETEQAKTRKAASLTVRMSGPECAQVHARAAEAGITVSAYVRSCVVEAENLRAQVKQALAEMRAGTEAERARGEHERARGEPEHGSVRGWRSRLFPRWASRNSGSS